MRDAQSELRVKIVAFSSTDERQSVLQAQDAAVLQAQEAAQRRDAFEKTFVYVSG